MDQLAGTGALGKLEEKVFREVHEEAGAQRLSWCFDQSFDSGMSSSECSTNDLASSRRSTNSLIGSKRSEGSDLFLSP